MNPRMYNLGGYTLTELYISATYDTWQSLIIKRYGTKVYNSIMGVSIYSQPNLGNVLVYFKSLPNPKEYFDVHVVSMMAITLYMINQIDLKPETVDIIDTLEDFYTSHFELLT